MPLTKKKKWDWEVDSRTSYWNRKLKEFWLYRHLIASLVRRDFLLNYQQTILGPIWILFQPLMTLATYVLVFGKMVGIPTGSIPPVLFYFSGIILWNLFNDCFSATSNTFRDNAHLFSKVYFPRLIMPIAAMGTAILRFAIQLLLLFILIGYYYYFHMVIYPFSTWFLALPLIILLTSSLALSLGLVFSVLTAKYRDLANLVALAIRLLMFITPVLFPIAAVPDKIRWIVQINPLTGLFELFRLSLLNEGTITFEGFLYSILFTIGVLASAMLLFNKQEDQLIDVV